MYNSTTEKCFKKCVFNLRTPQLVEKEEVPTPNSQKIASIRQRLIQSARRDLDLSFASSGVPQSMHRKDVPLQPAISTEGTLCPLSVHSSHAHTHPQPSARSPCAVAYNRTRCVWQGPSLTWRVRSYRVSCRVSARWARRARRCASSSRRKPNRRSRPHRSHQPKPPRHQASNGLNTNSLHTAHRLCCCC